MDGAALFGIGAGVCCLFFDRPQTAIKKRGWLRSCGCADGLGLAPKEAKGQSQHNTPNPKSTIQNGAPPSDHQTEENEVARTKYKG